MRSAAGKRGTVECAARSVRGEGAGPFADLQGGVLFQGESDGIPGLELKGLEDGAVVADDLHLGVDKVAHRAAERVKQSAERAVGAAVQIPQRGIDVAVAFAGGLHAFERVAAGLDILTDDEFAFPQLELLCQTEAAPDHLLPRLFVPVFEIVVAEIVKRAGLGKGGAGQQGQRERQNEQDREQFFHDVPPS